jgi:hypothetical protein
VLDASLKKNEYFNDYYKDSFYTSKIGNILDKMKYILNIFPENFKLMLTKDDYIVMIDNNKNYQKYDVKNRIIKKENSNDTVRYFYSDDGNKLIRIEFSSSSYNFYLIFENI